MEDLKAMGDSTEERINVSRRKTAGVLVPLGGEPLDEEGSSDEEEAPRAFRRASEMGGVGFAGPVGLDGETLT